MVAMGEAVIMAGMPAKQIGLVDSEILGFDLMLLIGFLAPYQLGEYSIRF